MQLAKGMMEDHLQMPPVMKERAKRTEVLAEDPEIAPVLTSKYVFVDTSEKEKGLSVCVFGGFVHLLDCLVKPLLISYF